MKDLHYSIEVVNSKDKSKLIANYTEAVFDILKNKLNSFQLEEILLKLSYRDLHNKKQPKRGI